MISRETALQKKIKNEDLAFLKREAAFIWNYFDAFLRPEDHYLPPDNYQEQPPVGLARRTSPTNIGLSILCVFFREGSGPHRRGKGAFPAG